MLHAALFGEMDPVTGVAANIMTGQPIRGGTSFSQVLLDEEAFLEMMKDAAQRTRGPIMERAPKLSEEDAEKMLESRDATECSTVGFRTLTALPPMDPAAQTQVPEGELPELEFRFVD